MIRHFLGADGVGVMIPNGWTKFIYAGRKYQVVYGVIVDVGPVKIGGGEK